jgi:Flp pilus assembly protein TadG
MERRSHANIECPHQHRRSRWLDERGSELIEFALVSPLFLMMMFGLTQYGFLVWQYNMISNLAQEGVRWASVRGANSAAPASGAQVQTYVQSRTVGMNVTVTTTSVDPATKVCTTTAVNPSTLKRGSGVCVKVQTTFTPLTSFIPISSKTLQVTAQMIMAR